MSGPAGDAKEGESTFLFPEVEVIVLSGHGTVEEAVAAMKEGAYDFLKE